MCSRYVKANRILFRSVILVGAVDARGAIKQHRDNAAPTQHLSASTNVASFTFAHGTAILSVCHLITNLFR